MSTIEATNISNGTTTVPMADMLKTASAGYLRFDHFNFDVERTRNISSVTDVGAGIYTYAVSNAFSDVYWITSHASSSVENGIPCAFNYDDFVATTTFDMYIRTFRNTGTTGLRDCSHIIQNLLGDPA